ncbi:serine hydrolase domain-containing protein [Clostridium merdae]|uniref:serine hydrolase domain-containing protein n=1 Tax=Clostridium merdae TaxID=1958780 RepID=UPI000A26C979|nr:serine hydrolase domain-containing protein [Clostridium merdae]
MLLVMQNGKPIYEKGFGFINKETKETWNAESITNIGSVSKIFVTAAILNLDQEKSLQLDSPVTQYLPEFKMKDERYHSITVSMLLNHSSGLPGTQYEDTFLYESTNEGYYQHLIENLANETLKSNPGEYPVYCNEGFILAQKIVEKVSGMDYATYINNKILAPMKVPSIHLSADQIITDKFVRKTDASGKVQPREVVIEALAGTGGLAMDAKTLALFGNQILSPQNSVLDTKHIALFCENQAMFSALKENSVFNALGWDYMSYPYGNLPVYSKNGGTIDYLSQIVVAPKSNLVVVGFATNPAQSGDVVEQLVTDLLVLKGDMKKTQISSQASNMKAAVTPQKMLDMQGKYSIIGGALAFDITISENRLNLPFVPLSKIGNEAGKIPYTYMDDGTFSSPQTNGAYEKFSFETINGKTFLMRHFNSDYSNYKVVYAQKVEAQSSSYGWERLNGTLWLKEDINPTTLSGMQDMISPLTVDPTTTGFVTFIRQTPFKTVSESLATTVNETARDSGSLIQKNKSSISFRGSNYVLSSTAKKYSEDVLNDILKKGSDKTNWLFCDKENEVSINARFPEVRVIVFDPNLTPVFDNVNASTESVVKIPGNSYIMVAEK